MTEPEDEFRESLSRIDRLPSPVRPLDPDELAARAGARPVPAVRRWLLPAVAVLVVGVAGVLVLNGTPAPIAAVPAGPSTSAASSPAPPPTGASPSGTTATATRPELPAGFRWASVPLSEGQIVSVGVPESWATGSSPDADYCFAEGFQLPTRPYVDENTGGSPHHASDCADLTAAQQAAHMSVLDPVVQSDYTFPWDGNTPGWKQWTRAVDGIPVTVTAPSGDADLAQKILATVTVANSPNPLPPQLRCLQQFTPDVTPLELVAWSSGTVSDFREWGYGGPTRTLPMADAFAGAAGDLTGAWCGVAVGKNTIRWWAVVDGYPPAKAVDITGPGETKLRGETSPPVIP